MISPRAGAALLLGLAVGSPRFALQELRWRSGEPLGPARDERLDPGRPAELARRRAGLVGRHALVRYERALGAHERELLAAGGVELGHALGGGAYFARIRTARAPERLAARLPSLLELRAPELAWKLHPALLAGETPSWTVADVGRDGRRTVAVYLVLQADVAPELGQRRVNALGASVLDVLEAVNGLVVLVPRERVDELAAADEVAWLEPALPRLASTANDSARLRVQAAQLQAAPYGLDGSGVSVLVYDEGTARASHLDFGGRLSVRDGSGLSAHATHVAATLGGDGSASGGTYKGMAPGVALESYGYGDDGLGIALFTNPGDLEDDYAEALTLHGADLANDSLSANVELNGFVCSLQGDYGVVPQLIDAVVHGELGVPFTSVWANGNERLGGRCDVEGHGDYYSMSPPATAKNALTVGALNSNDDTLTSFTSFGPTDDGRLAPTLCAPGCQSSADGGLTSASSAGDTAYAVLCGTSMSAPVVTGIAALILQDWRARFGGGDPRGATLKALLAHTAVDRGNVGPDHQFGYGSVRAKEAIDLMRLHPPLEDELREQGSRVRYTLDVAPGEPELKLTLAWDDAPALPNVFGSLVNDLDLVVLDPAGAQHAVWTLDPADPAAPAVQSGPARLDVLEQVLVESPAAGRWTVEVRAHSVPAGPQPFSLVSSHALERAPHVRISFPSGLPALVAPGVTTDVLVRVAAPHDRFVLDSPTLFVRARGPRVYAYPLAILGGGLYRATLPPFACSAEPEFGFGAEGLESGLEFSPAAAPDELYPLLVSDAAVVLADDFESNLGWTVMNEPGLFDGAWTRGRPAGTGTRGDPLQDFDGSGRCWLTDNAPGNTDVEGGPTRLISPLLLLSRWEEYEVSYAYWFSNDDHDADELRVDVSNDGGTSWTTAQRVTGGGNGDGWATHAFRLNDFVVPSTQVLVRFSVDDALSDSITEAAIDAFRVERRDCGPVADCNGNGLADADDIAAGRSQDANGNGAPDECEPFGKKKPAGTPGVTKQRGQ